MYNIPDDLLTRYMRDAQYNAVAQYRPGAAIITNTKVNKAELRRRRLLKQRKLYKMQQIATDRDYEIAYDYE